MRSVIPFVLLLVVPGESKDSTRATRAFARPPAATGSLTDPCLAPARVVVTLDRKRLSVGERTQAHALVYDSAGHLVQGCKVVWTAR